MLSLRFLETLKLILSKAQHPKKYSQVFYEKKSLIIK